MLEGWYCRSIANNNAEVEDDEEDSPEEEIPNYKDQYRNLKRKLKFLIYVSHLIFKTTNLIPGLHTKLIILNYYRKMSVFKKLYDQHNENY